MEFADYVIKKSNKLGHPVSNLMLQKVMYFLNVQYLLENGESLIDDDNFERWDYGPVLRSVYFEYSSNHSSPIKEPVLHFKFKRDGKNNVIGVETFSEDISGPTNEKEFNFIDDNISNLLNNFSPFALVDESHKETQWKKLPNNGKYSNQETINYYRGNEFWEM